VYSPCSNADENGHGEPGEDDGSGGVEWRKVSIPALNCRPNF
jgi:hypothetical protein